MCCLRHNKTAVKEYKINNEYKDQEGNLLLFEINIYDNYDLLVLNIYGSNIDNLDFFLKISGIISGYTGDFVILAGDFNFVQDPSLDYYNYNCSNNKKSREVVLSSKVKWIENGEKPTKYFLSRDK